MSADRERDLRTYPIFPLNQVVFPGVRIPLHVFEARYRALVEDLVAKPEPMQRMFATTAIREGYEVGEHGSQSLYRVGCLLRLIEVELESDGSYSIEAVVHGRFDLAEIRAGQPYSVADVELLDQDVEPVPPSTDELARIAWTAYRGAIAPFEGDAHPRGLPHDSVELSWTLARLAPLTLSQQQGLLSVSDTAERLEMVAGFLREEVRTVNVIPSLPAAQLARTAWSPN